MPVIRLEMLVQAGIEPSFDLSRSIDFHTSSMEDTQERAVAGVCSGLIGLGETVTWEARHFGLRQRLTSCISAYDRPLHFRDSMVSGAFRRFDHDHFFERVGEQTRIVDVFDFDAPLGPLGRIAEGLFLTRYMRKLLAERNTHLKAALDGDGWRAFLADGAE